MSDASPSPTPQGAIEEPTSSARVVFSLTPCVRAEVEATVPHHQASTLITTMGTAFVIAVLGVAGPALTLCVAPQVPLTAGWTVTIAAGQLMIALATAIMLLLRSL